LHGLRRRYVRYGRVLHASRSSLAACESCCRRKALLELCRATDRPTLDPLRFCGCSRECRTGSGVPGACTTIGGAAVKMDSVEAFRSARRFRDCQRSALLAEGRMVWRGMRSVLPGFFSPRQVGRLGRGWRACFRSAFGAARPDSDSGRGMNGSDCSRDSSCSVLCPTTASPVLERA
jgi:hypothetical protein